MGNTVRTIELVVWSREARFPNFLQNNEEIT